MSRHLSRRMAALVTVGGGSVFVAGVYIDLVAGLVAGVGSIIMVLGALVIDVEVSA